MDYCRIHLDDHSGEISNYLSWSQFHQHFTLAFFIQQQNEQLFSIITFGFVIFGAEITYEKRACKTLMKLTAERLLRKYANIRGV